MLPPVLANFSRKYTKWLIWANIWDIYTIPAPIVLTLCMLGSMKQVWVKSTWWFGCHIFLMHYFSSTGIFYQEIYKMIYLRQYMEHFYHSTTNSPCPMYAWEYERSLSEKYLIVWVSHVFNACCLQYCHILLGNIQNDLSEPIYETFIPFHRQ